MTCKRSIKSLDDRLVAHIKTNPGKTPAEIAFSFNLERHNAGWRLASLYKRGLLSRTQVRGRKDHIYKYYPIEEALS